MSGTTGYVPITVVNVSVEEGPTPDNLQRTGCFVSQGATTLTAGTFALLTQSSSLTSILKGAQAITSLAWTSGTATLTAAAHGVPVGDVVPVTISGAVPSAWNGTYQMTAATTTTLTFAVAVNPGTETTPGSYSLEDVAELQAMNNTFFGMGSGVSVYVLELGEGAGADGVTALQAFLTANPLTFYSYLLPHDFGITPTMFSVLALLYNADTAKQYFHLTTTQAFWQANPTLFKATLKCLLVTIENPTVAAAYAAGTPTEFSAAAGFWATLNLNPSPTNQVTQAAFTYLPSASAWPPMGNGTLFQQINAANLNIIGNGSEGGIATSTWLYGQTLDGNDFNKFWYSVDYVQVQLDLATSAAVIEGSNNPLAPLNYDQQGINALQSVAAQVMSEAAAVSLALGSVVLTQLTGTALAAAISAGTYAGQIIVNAVPFASYVQTSPADYPNKVYKGLSVVYTVQNGFRQIVYNVLVTNFIPA
jgi:hypothetical protein